MEISWAEIKSKVVDLVEGKISRKDVNVWSYQLMTSNDSRDLKFIPKEDENRIKKAYKFLMLADHQDSPTEYSYQLEEIKDYIDMIEFGQKHVKNGVSRVDHNL